ncbi:ATP-binding protein [Jeongeupia sp. HS-3]|uniref:ATP-binding protein n=1 Tax=Jeongeupia sp. HS-3 TaxID=1009682 RepID=UPI00190FD59D|nr:ATP-binding protein [Jeongeupia sp. HS-3]
MSSSQGWHYPRTELANALLNTLHAGLAQSVTLAAAGQMGKSEFLQYDLIPLAEQQGWRVRYFACDAISPKALLRQLVELLADFAAGEKWLARQFASLTGQAPKAKQTLAERLAKELSQLREEKRRSLLLIDDVDLVLRQANGDAMLRDILQAFAGIAGRAKLVMTASISNEAHAIPLLLQQQSSVLQLPDIGVGFVRHLVSQYQLRTQGQREDERAFAKVSSPYEGITWGQVDEGGMLDAFNRLQRIPYYQRALIEDLVLNPQRTTVEALQQQQLRLQRHRVSALSWEDMSRLDRLLLVEIAKGVDRLYGNAFRDYLAMQTGAAAVSSSQVQSSLKKLVRNRVLGQRGEGRFVIIDPHLALALSV